jgi:hypothetical protein
MKAEYLRFVASAGVLGLLVAVALRCKADKETASGGNADKPRQRQGGGVAAPIPAFTPCTRRSLRPQSERRF